MYLYKTILLLIAFLNLTISLGYADMGSCALYKVDISLKNSQTLTGTIKWLDSDEDIYKIESDQLLEKIKRLSTKTIVYKKIQYLNFPTVKYPTGTKLKYSAAAKSDVIEIQNSNVKSVKILSASPCGMERQIIILPQDSIDVLKLKPLSIVQITPNYETYDVDICLNYNANISQEELKSKCASLYVKDWKDKGTLESTRERERHYLKIENDLVKQKIIVIHVAGDY